MIYGLKTFFGTSQTCPAIPQTNAFATWCDTFVKQHHLSSLVFLTQTHSSIIVDITHQLPSSQLFQQTGDALITSIPAIGLGILTADCLPVILYDPQHQILGIAHVGWRGATNGIVSQLIQNMIDTYKCQTKNLQIMFGSSAQACCYQVSPDFIQHLSSTEHLRQENNKFFFDNPGYVKHQLSLHGIPATQINNSHAACTICNPLYYSYRRNPSMLQRQATIAWLR